MPVPLNHQMIQDQFFLCLLNHLLLYGGLCDESVYVHWVFLSNPVGSSLSLNKIKMIAKTS